MNRATPCSRNRPIRHRPGMPSVNKLPNSAALSEPDPLYDGREMLHLGQRLL